MPRTERERIADALVDAHDAGCEANRQPWTKLSMFDIGTITMELGDRLGLEEEDD